MTMSPRALGQTFSDAKIAPVKRRAPLLRRYTVASLDAEGREKLSEHMGPATAEFENAFNAFARGTVIQTVDGPCAVEDLRPGMMLETQENGPQEIKWIGSMQLVPQAPVQDPAQLRLTRVSPDRFGPAKPGIELMVGPGARLLHRPDSLRDEEVSGQAFTPFADFVDYDSVFEVTPPATVEMFHICTEMHSTIFAQGLAVETFHPGYHLEETMGPNKLALYLSLFPHIREASDFGLLAHPRMSMRTLMRLDAA
ncbi:MAG: Hint domain-containing protein [Pseudooceanicola sp.]